MCNLYCELDFQSLPMNPRVYNHSFARSPILYTLETNDRKNTSSGLQMNNRASWGSSGSQVGGLGETEVNCATNGTSNNPSGQDHRYIRHAVSDMTSFQS